MGKKRRIFFLALMLASAGAMAWVLFKPNVPEPVYKGKPLGFWLCGYDSWNYGLYHFGEGPAPTYQQADEAVRQLGANAIPWLLRMLQERDSNTKAWIRNHFRKSAYVFKHFAPQNQNWKADRALGLLGPDATNAVPGLIAMFEHDRSAFGQTVAPSILGQIGPGASPAVPALLRGLAHTNGLVRANSIYALRKIRPPAKFLVPELIKELRDTDALAQAQAARGLGDYGKDAEAAVPTLLDLWGKRTPYPTGGMQTLSMDVAIVISSWAMYPPGPGPTPLTDVGRTSLYVSLIGLGPPVADVTGESGEAARALKKIDPGAARKAGVK